MRKQEADRGKSVGYDEAYSEGYAAKYDEWSTRANPYPVGTPEHEGYEDGYAEAVIFAC
jgi:hypothetical protein